MCFKNRTKKSTFTTFHLIIMKRVINKLYISTYLIIAYNTLNYNALNTLKKSKKNQCLKNYWRTKINLDSNCFNML